MTVRAEAELDGGIAVAREAVIVITPRYDRRPYAVLAWREPAREAAPSAANREAAGGGGR